MHRRFGYPFSSLAILSSFGFRSFCRVRNGVRAEPEARNPEFETNPKSQIRMSEKLGFLGSGG